MPFHSNAKSRVGTICSTTYSPNTVTYYFEAEFEITQHTGSWQNYQRVVLGSFTEHRGTGSVELRAKDVVGAGLMNLRAVRLIPDRRGDLVAAAMAEAPKAKLRALVDEMSQDLVAGRTGKVAARYADDCILLGPGGYRVTGREAIDQYWGRMQQVRRWDLDVRTTEGAGDLYVQTGRSTLVRQRQGSERSSVVEFVLTWQKQADGEWRVVSDVYWPAH